MVVAGIQVVDPPRDEPQLLPRVRHHVAEGVADLGAGLLDLAPRLGELLEPRPLALAEVVHLDGLAAERERVVGVEEREGRVAAEEDGVAHDEVVAGRPGQHDEQESGRGDRRPRDRRPEPVGEHPDDERYGEERQRDAAHQRGASENEPEEEDEHRQCCRRHHLDVL